MLYDGDNLYLSFVLFDSDPDGIRATQLRRDSLNIGAIGGSLSDSQRSDDTIAVVLTLTTTVATPSCSRSTRWAPSSMPPFEARAW